MSRNTQEIAPGIKIHYGSDHAIGRFLDITCSAYAQSDLDEQGEGYVVEYCDMFKFSQNQIGIAFEDLGNKTKIIELVNKFIVDKGLKKN